ncbi:GGDEF domain-containing protein [Siccirubricoccus sp. KC 17139]|uniref:diguanylate cyclase n=1 Tax=Siccirubricoccus soli TaxID=2899147 RepID=A0ABT1D9C4_9PROT|nr:GGDEF domain-containing protein [Siccirubricoccus soli]MCO6418536.1 GGDEF domain-containing protein [Siccirubricoccus soli]MCP2684671.1 GGDEF domain-containing protein [Siccirubricoccus soli]
MGPDPTMAMNGSTAPPRPGNAAVAFAHAAIASMLRFGIRPTPAHFTIWYDFHSGEHPMVRRVLATFIDNGQSIDERLMFEVHERFYHPGREMQSFLDASQDIHAALQEVVSQVAEAGSNATRYGSSLRRFSGALAGPLGEVPGLLARLQEETELLSRRCDRLGGDISASAERIGTLERELAEARREATTDVLTGLPNRRAFEEHLRHAAAEATVQGHSLCLLIADIDRFKLINDTWGHPVGDAVLRRVAQTIQACLGEGAAAAPLAARMGGEEFAALLPHASLGAAQQAAERIRQAVSEKSFSLRSTGKDLGVVTISIGVAAYQPGEPLPCLVERADVALYQAKQAGRNRVASLPQPA